MSTRHWGRAGHPGAHDNAPRQQRGNWKLQFLAGGPWGRNKQMRAREFVHTTAQHHHQGGRGGGEATYKATTLLPRYYVYVHV